MNVKLILEDIGGKKIKLTITKVKLISKT